MSRPNPNDRPRILEVMPHADKWRIQGGEWHGPCPKCGGNDRCYLYTAPGDAGRGDAGRYHCRGCDDYGDAVSLAIDGGRSVEDAHRLFGVPLRKDTAGAGAPGAYVGSSTRGRTAPAAAPAPKARRPSDGRGPWIYTDEAARPLSRVVFGGWDDRGKKQVAQQRAIVGTDGAVTYRDGMTSADGTPVRRVLYRLPGVLDVAASEAGGLVVVVEGEKCVDELAGRLVDAPGPVAVTTSPGGSGAWRDEYADALKGAACVAILPDRDEPGEKYAQKVAASCIDRGIPVRVVRLATLPDGEPMPEAGDVADYLEAGGDAADVLALIDNAPMLRTAADVARAFRDAPAGQGAPDDNAHPAFVPSRDRTFAHTLGDAALVGLAGDIVRTLRPHTEAADAAMLVHALAAFGVAVGTGPYFNVGPERHPARVFVVFCGKTGSGRKGTAWSAVKPVFELAASDLSRRTVSSVQSGEALVRLVRDGSGDADAGAEDKRLLWIEPEFAELLSAKSRRGSSLTSIVRKAWDWGDLYNNTKENPDRATCPHVGIVGHVTPEELRDRLDKTDAFNGFLNRFLFVHTERARVLPFPDPPSDEDMDDLVWRLREAIESARLPGRVDMDEGAKRLWLRIYEPLTSGGVGLVGAISERAAPYVRRLAMIYALLDCRRTVCASDLRAALAVWRYSTATVRHVFGVRTGSALADRIVGELAARGEMTRTELSEHVGGRNRPASEITDALRVLHDAGLAVYEHRKTAGRPVEVWRLASTPAESAHVEDEDDDAEGLNEVRNKGDKGEKVGALPPSSPYFVPGAAGDGTRGAALLADVAPATEAPDEDDDYFVED